MCPDSLKFDAARPPAILVVDDEPEIRTLIREYFRMKLKADVTACDGLDSARVALDAGFQPALAIVDFNLRGRHTSVDLCRVLQKRCPDCRIIIISAAAESAKMDMPSDIRLEDYLQKPFSFKELLLRVTQILSGVPNEPIGFTLYPRPVPEHIETLYRLLEQCPQDLSVRHLLAFGLYTAERYAEAAKQYENVIKQGFDSYLCHYYHGHVLARLRRYEEAIGAWMRAHALAPTNESRNKVERRLDQGRSLLKMERSLADSGTHKMPTT